MGKHVTRVLRHARTVTRAVVFLSSYLSFCPSSIVWCVREHFNDRNLVLLNSAAWSDTDAKTFLELVVFPSGSPAPLSPPLYSCVFSIFTPLPSFPFLSPPQGDCQREREKETKKGCYMCLFESLFFCLPT